MSVQALTPECYELSNLDAVNECPPFAHFNNSPGMRERHVAEPAGEDCQPLAESSGTFEALEPVRKDLVLL